MNIDEFLHLDENDKDDLKKTLVIDDEVFILSIVEEVFKTLEGHICVIESNPKKGLELSLNHEFDLIMIDNIMPGILGSDFIKETRSGDGPNQDTTFLVCSANAEKVESENKDFENVQYIQKPLKLPTLVAVINDILK